MTINEYFAKTFPARAGTFRDFSDEGFDDLRERMSDRAEASGRFDDLPIIDIDDAAAEYLIG